MVKKKDKKVVFWFGIIIIVMGIATILMPQVLPFEFEAIAGQKTSVIWVQNGFVSKNSPLEVELLGGYNTANLDNPSNYNVVGHTEFSIVIDGVDTAIFGRNASPTYFCDAELQKILKPNSLFGVSHRVSRRVSYTGTPTAVVPYEEFERLGVPAGKHIIKIWDSGYELFHAGASWCWKPATFRGETFEIWIDGEGCELTENEMVVAETFAAGRTVGKDDLRFPVKGFCSNLPILVLEEGEVVEQKIEEYALIDNSYITIPDGQTWTVFYIADVDPSVAVVCKDGVYDAENSECVVTPPIVFSCSGDSVFDSEQQLCISQPETRIVCEFEDAVYDVVEDKCIKIIPVELQQEAVCPAESTAVIDNEGNVVKCIFDAPAAEQWVCEGGHLDTSTDPPICKKNAITEYTEIELVLFKSFGSVVNITTVIIGLILIVFGGVLVAKYK